MATIQASLFAPYTIHFLDQEKGSRAPSPPLRQATMPNTQSRQNSTIEIPQRPSAASLLAGPTTPGTPGIRDAEEFFGTQSGSDASKLLHARPGDPRSFMRSDANVPEWGKQAIFNQPKSRAGPLPSGSILDFAKVHEELEQRRQNNQRRTTRRSPHGRPSRAGSSERGYEGRPWTVERAIQGNGGLNAAVEAAEDNGEMDINWIGTLGFPTDALADTVKEDIRDKLISDEYKTEPVFVSDKDFDGHYAHYCKTILWPIFHYQVPDHPKSKAYADHSWEFYRTVNRAFADRIIDVYKRGDTIWVHDYHLLLVPQMVREKIPEARIGLFLHTAFPSSEVFRCLSTRKQLLEGMLGANLVAFQTEEYANHFLQTCSRLLTVETLAEGVQLDDHFVNVTAEPIGLNPAAIEKERSDPEVQDWISVIQERYKDKHIIVARDKLDNVRGVRQKLLAYELFLNKYPEWREKVVMIQVATSTSEQSELLTTVSDICTRIDSVHSTLAHQPLVFLKQDIGFPQYFALLSVADVLMITALRDGMNLTAHEYIYCQDGRTTNGQKKHGPLILSEFTGSATVLGDAILSINPWDYQQQADAIKKALELSEEEKSKRWNKLYNIVMTKTGARWVSELNKTLDRVHNEHAERAASSIPRLSLTKLAEKYKTAERRVFILDYEGTLAPHRTSTGIQLSSPQRVLDAISDLMGDSRNIVYVMSGRRPEELESVFRTLPSLGLIAENGCYLRRFGAEDHEWQSFIDDTATEAWKKEVRSILRYYEERLEGSYLEERQASLLFRWDKVQDQEAASRFAGESVDQINSACKGMRIHAVPINKAILIESMDFSKRTAATHIFDALHERALKSGHKSPDFMLVAGDDREDEVVFHWANDLQKTGKIRDVFTVSIGKRNTVASATLTQGSTGLLTALTKLGKLSNDEMPADFFNKGRGNSLSI